jgi:hypothetical protein
MQAAVGANPFSVLLKQSSCCDDLFCHVWLHLNVVVHTQAAVGASQLPRLLQTWATQWSVRESPLATVQSLPQMGSPMAQLLPPMGLQPPGRQSAVGLPQALLLLAMQPTLLATLQTQPSTPLATLQTQLGALSLGQQGRQGAPLQGLQGQWVVLCPAAWAAPSRVLSQVQQAQWRVVSQVQQVLWAVVSQAQQGQWPVVLQVLQAQWAVGSQGRSTLL